MPEPTKVRLSELMDARRKRAPLRLTDFSTNKEQSASQQAINKLLESTLTKAGCELDKFGTLLKQSDAEARQSMAQLIAEADKQSPAVLDTLHRTVGDWRNRVGRLTPLALPDAPARPVLLDTATEIVVGSPNSSAFFTQISTGTGPGSASNFAQFQFDKSFGEPGIIDFGTIGEVEVSFGFLLQNPSDNNAVVNVDCYILLNGFCWVFSDGGFLPGNRFSRLYVDAILVIHELWNEPPTSPIEQPYQSRNALDISCDSWGFLASVGHDEGNLFRGFDLGYSQFVLLPKGTAMFQVICFS